MYSNEEIENLINYIDAGEERINGARRIVAKNAYDFEMWRKYSVVKERCNYSSMLGIDTWIRRIIDKNYPWIYTRKGVIFDLDYIVDLYDGLLQEGAITEEVLEEAKKELIKLNFGSMKID